MVKWDIVVGDEEHETTNSEITYVGEEYKLVCALPTRQSSLGVRLEQRAVYGTVHGRNECIFIQNYDSVWRFPTNPYAWNYLKDSLQIFVHVYPLIIVVPS